MRIHCIRHEPFEGLASIENWISSGGHSLSYTHLYLNQEFPDHTGFDLLIIMGGTSSVYESGKKHWIDEEKKFINTVLRSGAKILGICFGAQILASVLGAEVYPGKAKEIGWFPVRFDTTARKKLDFLPGSELVFHWHGDTFDIPEGAIRLGSSEATPNQGFILDEQVFALQFHLELTQASLENMLKAAGSEITGENHSIQTREIILSQSESIDSNNRLMRALLDYISAIPKPVTIQSRQDTQYPSIA